MPVLGNEPLPTREDAQVFLTDVPRGTFIRGPSRTVRRADALAWMAERMFEPGDAPALAPDRHEIVVHVEAEVLADGRAGRCEIEHRTAIAAETARRLCCDAGIVPVVDGANGEPLSVGRRTRSIPPSVRRALASRDRGCRFPGCTATHRLHGHHVKHWANGGETSLDNLILLCRPITGWCTRADSTCSGSMTARSGSPTRTGWPSDPRGGKRHLRPTPSSSRTNPSGSPSTARPRPRTGTGSASTTTMR